MHGEPCVYVTPDAVFVGTRHKRVRCKSLSSPIKTVKEAERLVGELKPDAPLRSVAFAGNDPPSVNAYNVVFAGAFKLDGALPPTIGGPINTTSVVEIYEHFLGRKQANSLAEANALIAKMLADVNKGEKAPLICAASTKEAAVAYKSALMKKVYVHESMEKFIKKCKEDGAVECVVIPRRRRDQDGRLRAPYGKIVFEMFYRVDLTTMGAWQAKSSELVHPDSWYTESWYTSLVAQNKRTVCSGRASPKSDAHSPHATADTTPTRRTALRPADTRDTRRNLYRGCNSDTADPAAASRLGCLSIGTRPSAERWRCDSTR